MHNAKKFISIILDILERYIAILLMIIIFSLLMLEIITRYFFNNPLTWPEELIRFCFVAMIYLAISYTARQNKHIRIEVHLRFLSELWKVIILTIADILWIFYNIVIIYWSIPVIRGMLRFPYTSSALKLPMSYLYLIIPIGFSLMTIRVIQQVYQRLLMFKQKKIIAEINE